MKLKKEDSLLLNSIIDHRIYDNPTGSKVEFIIRPDCNQHCDYCYLTQHGSEIYPDKLRASNKTILKNIQLITEYFLEKKYIIQELDLFAGDLFYDDFFFDIMDVLYDFYEKTCKHDNATIVIPCNLSFCHDKEKIQKVQDVIDKFKKINVTIFFSYSTDGIYGTEIREHEDLKEDFFDTALAFCAKNHFGVHSMIGYENIDKAIDNYIWWRKKYQQYPELNYGEPMPYFLEVRNHGWTDETIKTYENFLNFVLNDLYTSYNMDLQKMIEKVFGKQKYDQQKKEYYTNSRSSNITLIQANSIFDTEIECGLNNFDICINCADMRIVPCHRLAYPFLAGGHFELNNDKLEIKADECINGYINLTEYNNADKPECITCPINRVCMKGCVGSQFEYLGDTSFCIPDVCHLLKSKYKVLFKFYEKIGLFDALQKYPDYPNLKEILKVRDFYLQGGFGDE